MTIPINPLRNGTLQRRLCPLDRERVPGAELFVAKKNALPALLGALDRGRSVGILADQRTSASLAFDVRNMSVLTTPLPMVLALQRNRPIVVGACYRQPLSGRFDFQIAEPIWPDVSLDPNHELPRLAHELDRRLTLLVRDRPEQYLWMHNRWKPHRIRKIAGLNSLDKSAQ